MKQIKDLKIGLPSPKKQDDADAAPPPNKVEPKILEDGTKVWPKVERRKVRFFFFFFLFPWCSRSSVAEVRDSVAKKSLNSQGRRFFFFLDSSGSSTSEPSPARLVSLSPSLFSSLLCFLSLLALHPCPHAPSSTDPVHVS